MKNKGNFKNRSICQLLQTFDREEVRDFSAFLAYKATKRATLLWGEIKKYHPEFDVMDQEIFARIKPNTDYKDAFFRIWVTDLYSMAKDYIAYVEFQKNKLLVNNTLSLALLHRDEEHTYLKVRRNSEKIFKEQLVNGEFYQYHFQNEDLHYQYLTIYRHRELSDSVQIAANCCEYNLLISKLQYLALMYNRQRITGEVYDHGMEEEILGYLDRKPHKNIPLVHLYYLQIKLFKNMLDERLFREFISYFQLHKTKIDPAESRQLLAVATNIAHWNIQSGKLAYLKLRFSIIKMMVEDGIAVVGEIYPAHHFRNIIRAAILAKELEWATLFLEENIDKTKEDDRHSLAIFFRAYIHFAKKEYDKQREYMNEMASKNYVFKDVHTNSSYRILGIKSAFIDLGETPHKMALKTFKSHMNSFRLFLKRQDGISDSLKLSLRHFYQAMNLIFTSKYGKRNKSDDLKNEIISLQPIAELPWLLEVID